MIFNIGDLTNCSRTRETAFIFSCRDKAEWDDVPGYLFVITSEDDELVYRTNKYLAPYPDEDLYTDIFT